MLYYQKEESKGENWSIWNYNSETWHQNTDIADFLESNFSSVLTEDGELARDKLLISWLCRQKFGIKCYSDNNENGHETNGHSCGDWGQRNEFFIESHKMWLLQLLVLKRHKQRWVAHMLLFVYLCVYVCLCVFYFVYSWLGSLIRADRAGGQGKWRWNFARFSVRKQKTLWFFFFLYLWRVTNLSVIVYLFLKISEGFLGNITVKIWDLLWHKFGGHVTKYWLIVLAKGLQKETAYVVFFKHLFLYDYLNIK